MIYSIQCKDVQYLFSEKFLFLLGWACREGEMWCYSAHTFHSCWKWIHFSPDRKIGIFPDKEAAEKEKRTEAATSVLWKNFRFCQNLEPNQPKVFVKPVLYKLSIVKSRL